MAAATPMSKPLPPRPEPAAGEKKPAASAPAPKPKAPRMPSPWPWPRWARVVASGALAFHLLAVFAAPWSIQLRDEFVPPWPPGRAWLLEGAQVVQPEQINRDQHPPVQAIVPEGIAGRLSRFPLIYHYANLLYINNGYDFFSPEPTGSFLLQYEVFDTLGQSIKKGQFPDRETQWPRLLYHRYMMLADQSSAGRPETAGWKQKIADRLLAHYHGASVTLTVVRHQLLTPTEVLADHRLNEPATYEKLEEARYFPTAPPPAETASAAQGPANQGGGR
jgi:hypothetical protein